VWEGHYNEKADVYSFGTANFSFELTIELGILLAELFSGKDPFAPEWKTPFEFVTKVRNQVLLPQIPNDPLKCHPEITKIIQQCVSFDPENRPQFSQIVATLGWIEG
jgi:serine/threonine protein kinase